MSETPRTRRNKFIPVTLPEKFMRSKKVLTVLQTIHPDHYGMLTAEQIHALCFKKGSKSYCDEVLRHMFHKPLQLVNRYPLLQKQGINNASLVYTITHKGSRLLHSAGMGRVVTPGKAYKMKNSTLLYREHEKGLNDVRIALTKGAELIGASIETWISDRDFKKPSIRRQLRVHDPRVNQSFGFQPDGFFVLRLKNGELKPFFLEYDNNTTSHKRFRNIKIRGYHLLGEVWRKLKVFEKYKDIPVTYRVLTVTNAGSERTFNFKQHSVEVFFAKGREKELNTRRFYFTQVSLTQPETIYTSSIWFIPFRSKTKEDKFAIFNEEM